MKPSHAVDNVTDCHVSNGKEYDHQNDDNDQCYHHNDIVSSGVCDVSDDTGLHLLDNVVFITAIIFSF